MEMATKPEGSAIVLDRVQYLKTSIRQSFSSRSQFTEKSERPSTVTVQPVSISKSPSGLRTSVKAPSETPSAVQPLSSTVTLSANLIGAIYDSTTFSRSVRIGTGLSPAYCKIRIFDPCKRLLKSKIPWLWEPPPLLHFPERYTFLSCLNEYNTARGSYLHWHRVEISSITVCLISLLLLIRATWAVYNMVSKLSFQLRGSANPNADTNGSRLNRRDHFCGL